MTGSFTGTVKFGNNTYTAANSNDLFIHKIDTYNIGTARPTYTSNIDTTQKAKGIAVDSSGNIYATGTFQNTVNFGGGNITSSGKVIYLLKLKVNQLNTFEFQWVKRFASDDGAAGQALGTAVTVDDDGNVYSVGQIGGNFNLGGQAVVSGSNNDAYIVKHDSSGTFQWSKTFGGGSGMDSHDKVQDIVIRCKTQSTTTTFEVNSATKSTEHMYMVIAINNYISTKVVTRTSTVRLNPLKSSR